MPPRPRLSQLFTHYAKLGGVESLLRGHVHHRHSLNRDLATVVFFEGDCREDDVSGLNLSGGSTIQTARHRLHSISSTTTRGALCVYHNLWGMNFLYDQDGCARRLGMLHLLPDGGERFLSCFEDKLDGLMCVSRPLLEAAQRSLPRLNQEGRLCVVPLPISPPSVETFRNPVTTPESNRTLVIGYCGRVCNQQKRVDLIPKLVEQLKARGIRFRLEILGDGPQLPWLKSTLGGLVNTTFHGRLSGSHYWRALAHWDCIVFLSEYEGLPISLLEALSVGVIPIYPRIQSGGDDYVQQISPELLYDYADTNGAANCIQNVAGSDAARLHSLVRAATTLSAPHQGDSYYKAYERFLDHVAQLPRISVDESNRRTSRMTDRVPFGLLRRFFIKAFYR